MGALYFSALSPNIFHFVGYKSSHVRRLLRPILFRGEMMRVGPSTLIAMAVCTQLLVGCGGSQSTDQSNMPPVDDSARSASVAAPKQAGMSTGKKIVLLAGAAALYYMYKKNQEKQQQGAAAGEPQYYLSKNGRVYYRDKQHRAHWVTPPTQGIQVPAEEAQQYSSFEGYDGQKTGRNLAGITQQGE